MAEWIVSSSLLIAILILLRHLLRGKISAKLQHALWALVLIRLLMPAGISETPFSAENAVIGLKSLPAVQSVIRWVQEPAVSYEEAFEQAEKELLPEGKQSKYLANTEENAPIKGQIAQQAAQIMNRSTPWYVLKFALYAIWYAGIVVVALYFLLPKVKFAWKLRRKRQLLHEGPIAVYTCEGLDTPCLLGWIKPAAYIPTDATDTEELINSMLARDHIRCQLWNLIWSAARCICVALHWYNPLVWIAAKLSRKDRLHNSEETVQKPKQNLFAVIAVVLVTVLAVGLTFTGGNSDNEIVTVYYRTQSASINFANGKTTNLTYQYDDNYNLVVIPTGSGSKDRYTYDENNRCTFAETGDIQTQYRYDEHGILVRKKVKNEYGDTYSHNYAYTYDSKGRLITRIDNATYSKGVTTYSYNVWGTLRSSKKVEYTDPELTVCDEYDFRGNLTSHAIYYNNTLRHHTSYQYDLLGRLSAYERTDDGEVTYRCKATYDVFGRLVKLADEADRSFDAMIGQDHEVVLTPEVTTYRYDLRGKPIKETHTLSNGDSYTDTRRYDIYGNLVALITSYSTKEYVRDAHGNIMCTFTYRDGKLTQMTTYTYDSVQVRRSDAERLWAQQAESFGSSWMPTFTAPEPEF